MYHIIEPSSCIEGAIRLVDGKIDHEGRVEVCSNGVWGSICDNYFDTIDGDVICRELGYERCKYSLVIVMHVCMHAVPGIHAIAISTLNYMHWI